MIQFLKNLHLHKKKDSASTKEPKRENKMKYEDFNFIRTLGTGGDSSRVAGYSPTDPASQVNNCADLHDLMRISHAFR